MKVLKPVEFSRKCSCCKAVVTLENSEMNFNGSNSRLCPNCGRTVFFTDSYGSLDVGVLVEYGLVEEVPERKAKATCQKELFS